MPTIDIILPKMGESISSGTLISWSKQEGDLIAKDEILCEIATDKVDSEIPSPVSGQVSNILFSADDVIQVGQVIATITTDVDIEIAREPEPTESKEHISETTEANNADLLPKTTNLGVAISPLVRAICLKEGIDETQLSAIRGSGHNGRIRKQDVLNYLNDGGMKAATGNVEVVEMDRMTKLIANHMVRSKHVSPHVTAYVEVDMTDLVLWRKSNKDAFLEKHGEKLTFTPFFVEAVCKAIREFPGINASVNGDQILLKKDINIGIATALPNGNLIVPVVHHADKKNLSGIAKRVNELVNRARDNKLNAEDVQSSTFTISNVGTFRNIMGTPIINQPEVAILATGLITKKPAVIETEQGDVFAARHMMYLSLSFDHRVVNGHLGGSFLARIGDHLQNWDINRSI